MGVGERGAQRSGVERVERVQATADAPDPPAQVATRALYSPLESPGTTAVNPNATSPVISRLTMVDLPMPGWPCTHMPVLDTRPWRSHSEGSKPTGSAVCMCRPIGTPGGTAPEATANGNSPHTWVVVACQTVPPSTLAARPPSATGQPQARGTGRRRYTAPGSAGPAGDTAAGRGPAPPGPGTRTGARETLGLAPRPPPAGAAAEKAGAASGPARRGVGHGGAAGLRGGAGRVIAAPGGRARRG